MRRPRDEAGAALPAGGAHLLDGAGEPAERFPVGPRLRAQGACFGLPRLAVGAGFFMKPVTLLLPCFQVGAVFGLGRQFVPARIPVPFPPEPWWSRRRPGFGPSGNGLWICRPGRGCGRSGRGEGGGWSGGVCRGCRRGRNGVPAFGG